MIPDDLLEILRCPESRQRLRLANGPELESLNRRVAGGSARNRAGRPVAQPLAEGLVREDARLLYPVRDGIPILLVDEAIDLGDAAGTAPAESAAPRTPA